MDNQTTNKPIFIPYKGKTDSPSLTLDKMGELYDEAKKITQDLGHAKLLSGLYFIFDAMERCGLTFFLVRDTAKKAMTEYMLEGDHLDKLIF